MIQPNLMNRIWREATYQNKKDANALKPFIIAWFKYHPYLKRLKSWEEGIWNIGFVGALFTGLHRINYELAPDNDFDGVFADVNDLEALNHIIDNISQLLTDIDDYYNTGMGIGDKLMEFYNLCTKPVDWWDQPYVKWIYSLEP